MNQFAKAITLIRASKWMAPRDNEYFDLIESLAHTACKAVFVLADHALSATVKEQRVAELENEGDRIEHEVLDKLNLHIDPPLRGRSSIRGLVRNIDNVLDFMKAASKHMELTGLSSQEFEQQCALLKKSMDIIQETMPAFRTIRTDDSEQKIQNATKKLARIESEGDRIHEQLLATLEMKKRQCTAIRDWHHLDRKEQIIELLEEALDQCEDVGHFMESLKLENM
jgi:uncharacterized protein Yka (UPF0111/DUF47 family)